VLSGAARTDAELMSSMMQKITLLEQKLEKQAQEIQLKVEILPLNEPVLCSPLTVEATVALHLLRPSLGSNKLICSL